MCKRQREMRDKSVAGFEASGGDKSKIFDRGRNDNISWYHGVPGLTSEVSLLAWKHRSESLIVVVTTSAIFDVEGRAARVSVMPRSSWNEDPRFLDTFPDDVREGARMYIDSAEFSLDAHYVVVLDINHSGPRNLNVITMVYTNDALRHIEIVDALTSAATTPEDLAAEIAYFKDKCLTQDQLRPIIEHFERQAAAHGPSRSLHNQLAYCTISSLSLEFRVRLVGLQGATLATHLNGRAGVIRDYTATDTIRFLVRLDDDGKEVSDKAENVERIRGDDYRRRAP
jgi:hypothetical protein